ncbi:ROK family protein [Caldivirga maquilingensis]|uniref:ROK family protein n=1 Tax=Caldivirga maquilingensis (strain ATCC 700844 / DSM 13496 / JCM 10307 / IC-167) TaxID=397948 RepID=A8M9Q1_CALMQ|nr:ROK family protein [Caldivirga maquilingensis]ABW00932.1 ROK family protein [Caldivirga maquilingensis IC-167]
MVDVTVVIDIGGSKIASALIYSDGKVEDYRVQSIDERGGEYAVNQVIETIRHYISGLSGVNLIGVGISIPGIVRENGLVWAPNIRGWRNINVALMIKRKLNLSNLTIIDDRVANIMGEYWQGAARGVSNAVSLMIGTGVAAGLLINGKPLRGSSGVAGAVGWWLLSRRIPRHKSSRGFLEDQISGPALFRKTYRYCLRIRDESCLNIIRNCNTHNAHCIFQMLDQGVALIKPVLEEAATIVGITAANLISLINPEVLVLSGGVGVEIGRRFMNTILKSVKVAQPHSLRRSRIVVSQLGYLSNLYGLAHCIMSSNNCA